MALLARRARRGRRRRRLRRRDRHLRPEPVATEIQAGSYALDGHRVRADGPGVPARGVGRGRPSSASRRTGRSPTAGSRRSAWTTVRPTVDGARVLVVSDEHLTIHPDAPVRVGDRIRVWPAHVDPTVAYHERMEVVVGEDVVETWPVDLRGW